MLPRDGKESGKVGLCSSLWNQTLFPPVCFSETVLYGTASPHLELSLLMASASCKMGILNDFILSRCCGSIICKPWGRQREKPTPMACFEKHYSICSVTSFLLQNWRRIILAMLTKVMNLSAIILCRLLCLTIWSMVGGVVWEACRPLWEVVRSISWIGRPWVL